MKAEYKEQMAAYLEKKGTGAAHEAIIDSSASQAGEHASDADSESESDEEEIPVPLPTVAPVSKPKKKTAVVNQAPAVVAPLVPKKIATPAPVVQATPVPATVKAKKQKSKIAQLTTPVVTPVVTPVSALTVTEKHKKKKRSVVAAEALAAN